jgi:CRISPR/Cas system-associated exonuclease Cas4 (RecB family)
MQRQDPSPGQRCRCGRDVFDVCQKCLRWGCYGCEFGPRKMKDPALCRECSDNKSFWEANSVAAKKKVKVGPVKETKLEKPKKAKAKLVKATAKGKQVNINLPAAPPPRQGEMFPIELRPVPRKIEAPVVDESAPAQPVEPSLPRELSTPPESSFTAPFVEGSLAHHLIQPSHRVDQVVERTFKKKSYPWVSEWTGAADAGDPCLRKLVYQRLHPEAAIPDEGEMAFLFKHGKWVEKEVYDEMAESGYEVVEQQRPFHDEELKVKGKIDGKLLLTWGGKRVRPPFEIKGYAPTTWERINSAKDMVDSHAGYLKKVPAQVMLYLVLDKQQEADSAIIYMKNKLTGKPKMIVVPRDDAYAQWLLGRLKVVREHVLAKTLPPRIEFEESSCGKCPFRGVCLRDMPAGPNPLVLDPEKAAMLLEMLEDWWKFNEARKAWKELDEKIAAVVRNHPKVIVGDFIVTGNPTTQNRLDESLIPPEELKKYKRPVPGWRKTIVNVKDAKGSGVLE